MEFLDATSLSFFFERILFLFTLSNYFSLKWLHFSVEIIYLYVFGVPEVLVCGNFPAPMLPSLVSLLSEGQNPAFRFDDWLLRFSHHFLLNVFQNGIIFQKFRSTFSWWDFICRLPAWWLLTWRVLLHLSLRWSWHYLFGTNFSYCYWSF